MQRTLAFVGSVNRTTPYLQGGARGAGISVFDFDEATGQLALLSERAGIDNPTYLTVDAASRCVYATSEVEGWNEGVVSAFRVDPASGQLRYINKQPTLGSIAAHCGLDRSGRHLFVSNYSMDPPGDSPGQSVAVFPVRGDGGLGPASCSVRHVGSGPVLDRQEGPHPHCALASPDNRFVLVTDLGTDRIVSYRFDADTGRLDPQAAATLAMPGGSGPRHLSFHPNGRWLYAMNEIAGTVALLGYDPATGRLEPLQSVSALAAGFQGDADGADLHVDAAGGFAYGSVRGDASIVAYAIDPASGQLDLVGRYPSGGGIPRSFALDPSGRFLLAANQGGDNLVAFAVAPETGALATAHRDIATGTPMCVKLARFNRD